MRSAIYHHGVSLGLLLVAPVSMAAPPSDPGEVLAEAWLRIEPTGDLQIAASTEFTVAEGRRTRADGATLQRIIASPQVVRALRDRGYEVEIARSDHRRGAPLGDYHTPEQGDLDLGVSVAEAPRAGLVQVGESVQGRPMLGAWFGQPPDSGAPVLRVLGAHHGDEWSSFEVALDLARTLAKEDRRDPDVTALLDRTTLWVVPYVNPDGVAVGSRYNANGTDLNRNYGFHWSASAFRSGDYAFSEPETRAIRAHSAFGAPYASLSLHSGDQNIGYVWNWSPDATPEEAFIADLAQDYADSCTAPGFWVTNGADWYRTEGDTNDWSYGRYGSMDFTVELTDTKTPDDDQIDTFIGWHADAVLAFLEVPVTLSGTVVDSDGQPVAARLIWRPDGGAAVPIANHPVTGSFHRATVGAGTLTVEAPGYTSVTVEASPGPLQVELPDEPLAAGVPSPRLVAPGATVTLPVLHDTLTLERPGFAPVVVEVTDGTFVVPEELAPGPWSLLSAEGDWPHHLFVEDLGPALVHSHHFHGTSLHLEGSGFGPGSRAWLITGRRGHLQPVPVVEDTPTAVVMDLSGLDLGPHSDVVVLSNGTQLAVLDVDQDIQADTGDPFTPGDSGEPPVLERGGCSCATGSGTPLLLWLPLLLLWRRSP